MRRYSPWPQPRCCSSLPPRRRRTRHPSRDDRARTFAPTAQEFQFGVCVSGKPDPHCAVDPGSVPKAVDLLTPPGVLQATELDYLAGPVVLQGVTIR